MMCEGQRVVACKKIQGNGKGEGQGGSRSASGGMVEGKDADEKMQRCGGRNIYMSKRRRLEARILNAAVFNLARSVQMRHRSEQGPTAR
jgi:hypothetical protein